MLVKTDNIAPTWVMMRQNHAAKGWLGRLERAVIGRSGNVPD
jgi:hypothetical protein